MSESDYHVTVYCGDAGGLWISMASLEAAFADVEDVLRLPVCDEGATPGDMPAIEQYKAERKLEQERQATLDILRRQQRARENPGHGLDVVAPMDGRLGRFRFPCRFPAG